VGSVASLFVSRWDVAVQETVPSALRNRLGIAVAQRTYREYRRVLSSPRWRTLASSGARPQRMLWASTGTKDPRAPDTMYIEALAAPDTIDTMPDKTLLAFADHGTVNGAMPEDGGDSDRVLAELARAGIDETSLATRLQREGTTSFDKSWADLLRLLDAKTNELSSGGHTTAQAHEAEPRHVTEHMESHTK
ncbi:MAG TPA: transaldolase family protein, partial [Gemmatimonadaceae bacterium]